MIRELLVAASYRIAVNQKVKQGQNLTNQNLQNRPSECDSVGTPMEVCVAFLLSITLQLQLSILLTNYILHDNDPVDY